MRLRKEGIHDFSTLLLGIVAGLEGLDFPDSYIGSWHVANKVAELLLQHFDPQRFKSLNDQLDNQLDYPIDH